MDTMKNLQDRIEQLIDSVRDPKDVEALEIVKNQVRTLATDQVAAQKEHRRMAAENMQLTSQNRVLKQQIERMKLEANRTPVAPQNPEPNQIIEHLGVLFARRPGGRVVRAPFCPKCRRAMKAVSNQLPFTCSNCRTTTPFTASEINDVALQLERG